MKLSSSICNCTYCYDKDCPCSCHNVGIQRGTDEGYSAVPYIVGVVILFGLIAPFIYLFLFGE